MLALVLGVVAVVAPAPGVVAAATVPVVSGLSPSSGVSTGGTVVTVTGSGFTGTTRVAFATTSAAFTVIDDATIEVIAPRRPVGVATVRVTTPAGRSAVTGAAVFTYTRPPAPFITSITPPAGPTAGGTTLVIQGTGFTGATGVTIGGRLPLSYTIDSSTQITVVTPFRRVPGTVNVRITGPGGTSAITPASKYTYTTAPPPPPVAVADAVSVSEDDGPLVVDVLANDLGAGPISIASVTQPGNGTVVNNGADLTYEPAPGYCNDEAPTDDFTYTLAPGGSSATVSVTVACMNDAPTVTSADVVSVVEGQTSVIDVEADDPDGDTEGNGLTYLITGGADNTAFAIDTDTGVLTFVTAPDFEIPGDADNNNEYVVEVTVTDSGAGTDTQTITVTVTNENNLWARNFGGTSFDLGLGVAVDAAGNAYTTGLFAGTADFDPGPGTVNLTSNGFDDVFVTKLDENGNLLWARSFGGASSDLGLGVALDANGNAYITGLFAGTADFDPGPGTANLTSNGNDDVFVTKLDNNGNLLWARSFGGASSDQGFGVALDANGNAYITGLFAGTADFDPGPATANLTSNGGNDVFVTKLDDNGNLLWARNFGGANSDFGRAVAVDGAGAAYITGDFLGTADFDPGPGTVNVTSNGIRDVFVISVDENGNLLWVTSFGGTSSDQGFGVAVDSAGNTYTTGLFFGTVDFDPGPGTANLTSNGNDDLFVAKLGSNGSVLWARNFGGTSDDFGRAVAVDGAGNPYISGDFQGTADFDPGPGTTNLTSNGLRDVFVTKLADDGNLLWARGFGGTSFDQGVGLAVDAAGNTYTTGYFWETVDFDPGTGTLDLTSNGSGDVFVTKLDGNGNLN